MSEIHSSSSTTMIPTNDSFIANPDDVASTVLPEVVGKLFMLDDTFFRSPFLRKKLPPILFSNGSSGFDRFFSDFGPPRSARSSFFQPPSDDDIDGLHDSGPPTPTDFPNLYNHRFGGYETAEPESNPPSNSGVIRNIPIRVEQRKQPEQVQPVAATTAFSTQPIPQFATVTTSVHHPVTPILTPSLEKPTNPPRTYPVPIYQRETSHPVIFRRSQPDSLSLRSVQFPSEERAAENGLYSQLKRSQSSGRVSPSFDAPPPSSVIPPNPVAAAPEPPQRRSFSRLLQNQRPISEVFEPSSQPIPRETKSPTPSMPSYRFDRPTTPLSQKSRPKSPSLQSLRNGFRKATNCVRRPTGHDSDGEPDMRPAPSMVSMQPSTNSATSSSLYAAISRPTPVTIKNHSEIDAVEEAIRSLESFDPSKIIADAAAERRNAKAASSGSDTDSGSVIVQKEVSQRPSESPTSSGIVADIRDGSLTRTSGFSNRSSVGSSSHEGASISSSENDTGSYILVDPQRHQFRPPATSSAPVQALPQPPAISRVAHLGSFGANPQRATIVSSPSSSTTSTLTRGEHVPPQRAPEPRAQPKTVLPPPPEIITDTISDSNNEEEDAAAMRKRILCAQMTDCAKVIEINGLKMSQFTSSSNWRHPHLLQRNLPGIQDTVYIIEAALDELLEFTQRISMNRGDPKQDELVQMVAPLRTSQALIHRLRAVLDSTQWNIHTLARPNGNIMANDALDQFVAILHQLPKDCRKLVQWVYLLGTSSHSGTQFLPRHSPGAVPFPVAAPQPVPSVPDYLAPRGAVSRQIPPPPPLRQQLSPLPLLTPPTMEEIAMDGGESTTSSNGSSATDIVQVSPSTTMPDSATPVLEQVQRQSTTGGSVVEEDDLVSIAESKHVYEEDDLMSLASESSLFQDYSLVDGSLPRPQRTRRQPLPKIDPALVKDISETEKELLRPYASELESHMTGLCKLIEEFFHIIEQSREPSNFVQKVRLLILKAQFLVNIGDHMAQCCAKPALRAEFRHSSDRLNSLLSQCVSNAQIAKDQYPSVEAVQAMMSSVVAVSDAAQHLKQLGKSCI